MNDSAGAAASATAAVPHVDVADKAGLQGQHGGSKTGALRGQHGGSKTGALRGQHGGSKTGVFLNSGLAGGVDSSRWRDLFPLPHAPLPVRIPGSSSSSRRSRRPMR